jgi:hypothetical protein
VATNVPIKKGMIAIVTEGGAYESYLVSFYTTDASALMVLAHSTNSSNFPIFPTALFIIDPGTSATPTFSQLQAGATIIPGMRLTTTSGTFQAMISAVTYSSTTAGSLSLSASVTGAAISGTPYNASFGTTVGSNITFSGSNIVISNAVATKWSVTYFPTP